jgi:rare lipoprotein A
VQAGAFADQSNARRVLQRLRSGGIPNAFILSPPDGKPTVYRVRLGPISSVPEFDQLAAKLKTLGFPDARLATD